MKTETKPNRRVFAAAAVLLAAVLLLGLLPLIGPGAHAETSGVYTYEVAGGKATITECKSSVSGALTIPSELGGYPVVTLGEDSFYKCTGLTSVVIPDTVTTIGVGAFSECSSLTKVTIPSSVKWIKDFAFDGCVKLKSVTLPEGVKAIYYGAFYGCKSLTSITIPKSVETIGAMVFADCTNLKTIKVAAGNARFKIDNGLLVDVYKKLYAVPCAFESVTIPKSVEIITTGAFIGCSKLTDVTIPARVWAIHWRAFDDCASLTDIWCVASEPGEEWEEDFEWLGEEQLQNTEIHWGELQPPADLKAEAAEDGGIEVSWKLSPEATKYNVYRKDSGSSWRKIGYSREDSFTDETALSGVIYYYRVRAQVSSIYSPYSTHVPGRWPAAPAAPAVTNYTSGIKVVWTEAAGAEQYHVWRALGNGTFQKIATTSDLSYVDKTAAAGKTYYYAIKAQTGSGYSALGEASKITRLTTPAVTAKAYASGIKLTWDEVPGATRYNVWRKAPGGDYEMIDFSRTLSYVDRTVTGGKKYSYYVVAQYSASLSARSGIVSATAK